MNLNISSTTGANIINRKPLIRKFFANYINALNQPKIYIRKKNVVLCKNTGLNLLTFFQQKYLKHLFLVKKGKQQYQNRMKTKYQNLSDKFMNILKVQLINIRRNFYRKSFKRKGYVTKMKAYNNKTIFTKKSKRRKVSVNLNTYWQKKFGLNFFTKQLETTLLKERLLKLFNNKKSKAFCLISDCNYISNLKHLLDSLSLKKLYSSKLLNKEILLIIKLKRLKTLIFFKPYGKVLGGFKKILFSNLHVTNLVTFFKHFFLCSFPRPQHLRVVENAFKRTSLWFLGNKFLLKEKAADRNYKYFNRRIFRKKKIFQRKHKYKYRYKYMPVLTLSKLQCRLYHVNRRKKLQKGTLKFFKPSFFKQLLALFFVQQAPTPLVKIDHFFSTRLQPFFLLLKVKNFLINFVNLRENYAFSS